MYNFHCIKLKILWSLFLILCLSSMTEPGGIAFKYHNPCSFSVELPSFMVLSEMYNDQNPDYCDYEVILLNGFKIIECHSMLASRFPNPSISDSYLFELKSHDSGLLFSELYQNSYIVASVHPENGLIIYQKRIAGRQFISDLIIIVPEPVHTRFKQHIDRILHTFSSE
jgi:hypothetical protein